MPWPSREEIIRQVGLDIEDEAVDVCASMRSALKTQREEGIDACDHDGHFTNYTFAAADMYIFAFGPESLRRMYHDQKRDTVWYLGRKPREDAKDLFPNVRMIYSVRQNSRYLKVYAGQPNEPPKRILAYDMQDPKQRQAFISVRTHAAQKLPIPNAPATVVRGGLLDVQQDCRLRRRLWKKKWRRENAVRDTDGGMSGEMEDRRSKNDRSMEHVPNQLAECKIGSYEQDRRLRRRLWKKKWRRENAVRGTDGGMSGEMEDRRSKNDRSMEHVQDQLAECKIGSYEEQGGTVDFGDGGCISETGRMHVDG